MAAGVAPLNDVFYFLILILISSLLELTSKKLLERARPVLLHEDDDVLVCGCAAELLDFNIESTPDAPEKGTCYCSCACAPCVLIVLCLTPALFNALENRASTSPARLCARCETAEGMTLALDT